MELVFGRQTFDCFKQAERDWAVGINDWAQGFTAGYDEGFRTGQDARVVAWSGFSPFTQSEWDEAHNINYGVDVLDQMRADCIAGAPFFYTDEEQPPYDVSAECHDSQFECCCGAS